MIEGRTLKMRKCGRCRGAGKVYEAVIGMYSPVKKSSICPTCKGMLYTEAILEVKHGNSNR